MNAVAERHGLTCLTVDVERVGVGIAPLVPIRRTDEKEDGAARRDHLPVDLHVVRDVTPHMGCRRFEAEELLDRVGDERRIVDQLAPLLGVLGKHLSGPSDEAVGGLIAGTGEHVDVNEDLVRAQATHRAGLVFEFRVATIAS